MRYENYETLKSLYNLCVARFQATYKYRRYSLVYFEVYGKFVISVWLVINWRTETNH